MTNVVMSFYIEVVNAMLVSISLPLIYVIAINPLQLVIAQLATISIYSCFTLIVALGSAISCFQILYVVKFELLFPLDPQIVGKRICVILCIVIFVPNIIMGAINTMNGIPVDKGVAQLTQTEYSISGPQFLVIYAVGWAFLYFFYQLICICLSSSILLEKTHSFTSSA
jgi:hypothetical protein